MWMVCSESQGEGRGCREVVSFWCAFGAREAVQQVVLSLGFWCDVGVRGAVQRSYSLWASSAKSWYVEIVTGWFVLSRTL